jgi:hypothetical protein
VAESKPPSYSERMNPDVGNINDTVMFQHLPVGTRLKLRDGAIGEITGNPGDGGWLFVKIVESPERPSRIGEEEMAFCTEVVGTA